MRTSHTTKIHFSLHRSEAAHGLFSCTRPSSCPLWNHNRRTFLPILSHLESKQVRVPPLLYLSPTDLSWNFLERLRVLCGCGWEVEDPPFPLPLPLMLGAIFCVREWEPSVCAFGIFDLVALGNLCDWGFTVTLGDCHHLDGLLDCDSVWSTWEDCAVLRRRICEGYSAHPAGIAKSNSSRARHEGRQMIRPGQVLELVVSTPSGRVWLAGHH